MSRLFSSIVFMMLLFTVCEGANPKAKAPLKLYVFDCGKLRYDNIESFGIGNNETAVRELIVP